MCSGEAFAMSICSVKTKNGPSVSVAIIDTEVVVTAIAEKSGVTPCWSKKC